MAIQQGTMHNTAAVSARVASTLRGRMRDDGSLKRYERESKPDATEQTSGRGESWQAAPSRRSVRNARSDSHDYKPIDSRTGLKTTDDHASWRQVYRHCHVGVGMQ